jgi:hypothetical protein
VVVYAAQEEGLRRRLLLVIQLLVPRWAEEEALSPLREAAVSAEVRVWPEGEAEARLD